MHKKKHTPLTPSTNYKYWVSYCDLNEEAGSNPFGHICIIISKQSAPNEPILVEASYGFYSQESTSTNPVAVCIKKNIGLKFDFQNTHGHLKQESMRFLDRHGLNGVNFEVDEHHYKTFKNLCDNNIQHDNATIEALNAELTQKNMKPNGVNRYKLDHEQAEKKAIENLMTKQSSPEASFTPEELEAETRKHLRLQKFHLAVNFNLQRGFYSDTSHTCKNRALSLLLESKIIDEETKSIITGNKIQHAFPHKTKVKYSPIGLASSGTLKKLKPKHFYRDWEDGKLFWFIPPTNYYKGEKPYTRNPQFTADRQAALFLQKKIKPILKRTRSLEEDILNEIARLQSLKKIPHRKTTAHDLGVRLVAIQKLYKKFYNQSNIQNETYLENALAECTKELNVAAYSLIQSETNYPFLMLLYQNLARLSSVVLVIALAVAISALLLSPPATIVLFSAAGVFTGYQLFKVAKKVEALDEMQADYEEFREAHPEHIFPQGVAAATV